MAPISNGYFNFSSGHQGTSSRGFIKAQKKSVNLKYQLLHQEIIGYSHSQYSSKGILAFNSQGIFKRNLQNNFPRVSAPSIHLGNHIHSIDSGFIKNCIFKHTPWEFPNLERYILHQAVNTAPRIQYRPAVSLKESSSQLFTYTTLLGPWGVSPPVN
ncbi:hypothetical protein O181_105939 [Austropuccinia psidii MF-1]|uniref:Uncharacterized protein n=1 Tax=Austropuccinia psidii MF-1 TaxID=1389203 RepID=A0A9Q3PLK4_9BASI|nr:hypothetical protein [Austropuccinia psidii MF-1]